MSWLIVIAIQNTTGLFCILFRKHLHSRVLSKYCDNDGRLLLMTTELSGVRCSIYVMHIVLQMYLIGSSFYKTL